MGLLQDLASAILSRSEKAPQIETPTTNIVLTKAPGFAVTNFVSNNPFTNIIEGEDNYFSQYVLYTAKSIDYISSKVASAKIKLVTLDGKTEKLEDVLFTDLQSFNPYMNLWEARKLREMHLALCGAAFWYIDREPQENENFELYPLDPTQMQLKTGADGLPNHWQYTDANGKMVELSLNDVIYFRRMNPKNWFEGLSQVKTMSFWTNAYGLGAKYNQNKLGNSTNADKFIVFDGISSKDKDRMESQLQDKYNGPQNAGRTGILAMKPEVIDMAPNQKDLDWVAGMTLLRQDILAGFGIPEALFFPSATNSNTTEARRLFQADTIEPLMEQEAAALNEQLIKRYKLKNNFSGGKLRAKPAFKFDFYPVVDADKDALVTQAQKMRQAGVFTRDQALQYIGEEAIGGELGQQYMTDNPVQQGAEEEIKSLTAKAATVSSQLSKLLDERDREDFIQKNAQMADDQEGIMHDSADTLFQAQFSRVVDYINKTKKVTLQGAFDMKSEIAATKQAFKESYFKVLNNSNDVGNVEIKSALVRTDSPRVLDFHKKSVSGEALNALERKLSYFAKELNETTLKELRKILAEGIEAGFDKKAFRDAIAGMFGAYLDGKSNIEVLKALDLYEPPLTSNEQGNPVMNNIGRDEAMLDKTTEAYAAGRISKDEMEQALKALRGLVNPTSPAGKRVDDLLTTVYGVNKDKDITRSRVVRIARTESTYARNLGFNDMYKDNPFVTGKKWKSAFDKDTRDAHANASELVVAIDEPFNVGGEQLMFPGDTSLGASAKNIVNCRCRIVAVVE